MNLFHSVETNADNKNSGHFMGSTVEHKKWLDEGALMFREFLEHKGKHRDLR